jgi:hypothetical protein
VSESTGLSGTLVTECETEKERWFGAGILLSVFNPREIPRPAGEGAGASEWRTRTAISDGATAEMSDRLERHAFEAIIART